jgi:ADP-heptose:LPS heptosyltransferase
MKRMLVIRFSSLGDVVLITGVIRLFKKFNSDIEVDVLTYEEYKEVFTNNIHIHHLLFISRKLPVFTYLKSLIKITQSYDYIIDLQKNMKTVILKFVRFSRYYSFNKLSIKRRLFVYFRWSSKELKTHITERYLQAFSKVKKLYYNNLEELRPEIYANSGEYICKKIIVHPFASKKTKEWPHFYELIKILVNKGFDVAVVGKGERNLLWEGSNLVNGTTLKELINEINKGDTVITTDSGPMHLAIALNKTVIAIFGSTTKEMGFYPVFKNTYVFENGNLSCRPCHVHGKNKCPKGHFKCMRDIDLGVIINFLSTIVS